MPFRPPTHHAVTPQHRGRFPGFDVLDQADQWDEVTAGVVLARLALPDMLSFFTPAEVAVAAPLLDLLLAQDGDPKVPVLALIDARLAAGETDGWHYDDMPEDGQAWRDTLAALDDDARDRHDAGYAELTAAAAGPAAAGRPGPRRRRATAGTAGRPATCGVCGPGTPARPSTPIRGRGTRSGSPARPIPAAISIPASTPANTMRSPTTTTSIRSRSPPAWSAPVAPTTICPSSARMGERSAVRARNESAWLLPNDGSRTNHRLRADMRRYAPDDEVDVVIVGAGAGGATLGQRLARAGWSVVLLDAGPFWDPDSRLGQRRTRVPRAVLDRTPPDRRGRPGSAGLQQLRSRRRRVDGALRRLHPAVPSRPTSTPTAATGWAPTGPSSTPTCAPTTSRSRPNFPWPVRTGRGATRTAIRTARIRSAATD